MKKVELIVHPFQVTALRDLLGRVGVDGMCVSEVRGLDSHEGHVVIYRGFRSLVFYLPKMKVEIVVEDGRLPVLVDEIDRSIRPARPGDGRISVIPLDDAVCIRTGRRGCDAI